MCSQCRTRDIPRQLMTLPSCDQSCLVAKDGEEEEKISSLGTPSIREGRVSGARAQDIHTWRGNETESRIISRGPPAISALPLRLSWQARSRTVNSTCECNTALTDLKTGRSQRPRFQMHYSTRAVSDMDSESARYQGPIEAEADIVIY